MSVMDKLKGMLKAHPEQAGKAIDKGAAHADKKTHGKYRSRVETARNKAKEQLRRQSGQEPRKQ